MPIYERTPYAGELVFTAFSGSHQDAIRKGMAARVNMDENSYWDVPYLPIDPHDVGRQYEGIIRINSQSGKGGAAFIMEQEYGVIMPKAMHTVFGSLVKTAADKAQRELQNSEIYDVFTQHWIGKKSPLTLLDISETHTGIPSLSPRAMIFLLYSRSSSSSCAVPSRTMNSLLPIG